MKPGEIESFQQVVWGYYADYGRDLPWRFVDKNKNDFAYHVLVSEFMLQQTQVNRVITKYDEWLNRYPRLHTVAEATLTDVLSSWSGLGYNRRAKYLYETCKQINATHGGKVPDSLALLQSLPGIGHNTAAAILAYAYNQPAVFIETNIRTVFIHHFFKGRNDISDAELLPFITKTLNTKNPREWYWALMDYGTYLKKEFGNASSRSKHHVKQSRFEGSNRQIRGAVIRALTAGPKTITNLGEYCNQDPRLKDILRELEKESLITKTGVKYRLATG